MKHYHHRLFMLLFCIGIFYPINASANSIDLLTKIVYIRADASTWEISLYNKSPDRLKGITVQAYQSVYRPEKGAAFENDLTPASGFKMNLPPEDKAEGKIAWNKRNGAKTLQIKISWQGSARTAHLDLTKQYTCTSSDIRHPDLPLHIESMQTAQSHHAGYTNKLVMVFNNPTSNFIDATISPWRQGPNGDKIPLKHKLYMKKFYPDRTTEVSYHFNEIQGTEEYGVEYWWSEGNQGDRSQKVICKNPVPFVIQQKQKLKIPAQDFKQKVIK